MKTYRVVLWALALLGLAADQATKYSVFSGLARVQENRYWLYQPVQDHGFALETRYASEKADGSFVPHVNQGALFGLGREHEAAANGCFAVVSLLAAAFIVYWSMRPGAAHDLWVCMSLGLILAGTLGNLYDRVVFTGVRDFLHWNYWFDWPVFNIADACLVCGACLLLLQAFGRQAVSNDDKPEVDSAQRRGDAPVPVEAPVSCATGVSTTQKA